jgi:DNA-binding CsgD family transcriptional regulator
VLRDALAGRSRVLVIHGPAGIGKTALLDHCADAAAASEFRVESSTGVEAEAQFAFAGLHQFCSPLLDHLDALPEPQRVGLGVALGMQTGPTPDKFLVGLATLHLVAEVAEHEPLLCLVDDAQWLDQASAEVLAFVARRVDAERLAIVFAERDVGGVSSVFSGLPDLPLAPLEGSVARELLETAVVTPLDDAVRDRILAEARGNPLALLELPASAPILGLVGEFHPSDLSDAAGRVESGFRGRSSELPETTQLLLLAAAAEPTGDPALLLRATAELGLSWDAAAPAEAAGLIQIDSRVRFRHPLVRSAAYQSGNPADRRRVHDALATATDPVRDPDRWAWHRAQAVLGVDEEIAAELERSAERAQSRGGYAAAGAFLRRSAQLTPDSGDRRRRAWQAAQALHTAGASEAAFELLEIVENGAADALERARVELLRAQIAFHLTHGEDVPRMLMEAAETFAPVDPLLSRETYLHALDAAIVSGSPATTTIAQAALGAPTVPTARPSDLLLDGLATTTVSGFSAGIAGLQLALQAFSDRTRPEVAVDDDIQPWLWLAARVAVGALDDDRAHQFAECNVAEARRSGALSVLPAALSFHANILIISGQLTRAAELAAEAKAITDSTGGFLFRHAPTILAAWRGDRAAMEEINVLTLQEPRNAERSGEVSLAHYASAVLYNGLGEYASAQVAAAKLGDVDELSLSTMSLPELVEAAVRAGDPDTATDARERFTVRATATGTAWALGLDARSRALTTEGPAAEEHYLDAVTQLNASKIAGEAARAHLVYGEWLRREGRRHEARTQLRTAHEAFLEMGVGAFGARAARELRATGEHPRKRTVSRTDELTAQEMHIARLAATGATSRELGAQLFLSPRTIESHLRNIFRKLDISSRRELRQLDFA